MRARTSRSDDARPDTARGHTAFLCGNRVGKGSCALRGNARRARHLARHRARARRVFWGRGRRDGRALRAERAACPRGGGDQASSPRGRPRRRARTRLLDDEGRRQDGTLPRPGTAHALRPTTTPASRSRTMARCVVQRRPVSRSATSSTPIRRAAAAHLAHVSVGADGLLQRPLENAPMTSARSTSPSRSTSPMLRNPTAQATGCPP